MIRTLVMSALAASGLACAVDGGSDDASADGPGASDGLTVVTSLTPPIDDPPTRLDLAGPDPFPGDCWADVKDDFSFIWIANTGEGTVSKIDTVAAIELARYRTGPGNPDPSRTSASMRGDVAVANRAGSVTKIAARLTDCMDLNGNGVIDTSQGPDDIREWGTDDCVVWHYPIDFPQGLPENMGGPRGIAWDRGSFEACHADADVWISWRDQPRSTVEVRRLGGTSGAEEAAVQVPDWHCKWGHGPYGAVTDGRGAYWALGTQMMLVRVDPGTLAIDRFEGPAGPVAYGIAIDALGDPWLSGWEGSLWRFDVEAAKFEDHGDFPGGPKRLRGLAIDASGHAWIAGNDPCALVRYDTRAHEVVAANIPLPGCGEPVGVSVDRDKFVWVVDQAADRAYKVDPGDYTTVIVGGLVSPYTYSDMTGQGLEGLTRTP